jgi:polyribonucleotide nucleotidyltransferase
LLHVSEIADYRVRDVRDELHEGQQIMVKCIGVEGNKIRLSRKAILMEEKKAKGGGN